MQIDENGGGAAEAVLSKACDTGPLGAMIDGIISALEGLQTCFNTVMGAVQTAIDIANRMTLGLIPWLSAVRAACDRVRQAINRIIDIHQEALKGLEAPWYIKCIGEKLRDGMAPRAAAFADSLDPDDLASKDTWKGPGSEAFFKAAGKQQEAAKEAKGGVLSFGNSMVSMGDSGISATYSFLVAMGFAIVGYALAVAKMAAVPVGTAIGAAEIIGLIAATVAIIKAFVDWVVSASNKAREFSSAVATVPMQGNWPAPVV